MKNAIKLGLLSLVVFLSACSSEPKSVQYYKDPKNAEELEAKLKECDKNPNASFTDQECENARTANYGKSFDKPRLDPTPFFNNNKDNNK